MHQTIQTAVVKTIFSNCLNCELLVDRYYYKICVLSVVSYYLTREILQIPQGNSGEMNDLLLQL